MLLAPDWTSVMKMNKLKWRSGQVQRGTISVTKKYTGRYGQAFMSWIAQVKKTHVTCMLITITEHTYM